MPSERYQLSHVQTVLELAKQLSANKNLTAEKGDGHPSVHAEKLDGKKFRNLILCRQRLCHRTSAP